MEFTYFTSKNVKETTKQEPEDIAFDIIHNIGHHLVGFAKTLKRLENDSPNGTLSVKLTYNTEGVKDHEPSEEKRQQLSALARLHKCFMDKVKSSTEMEDILVYGQMANTAVEMMKEIESENDE